MKPASSTLIDYLATADQLTMADCFSITLRTGTVLRYTSADMPVVVGGELYLANGVRIDGLKYSIKIGVDVDEQDITIAATASDLVGGVPFLAALRDGVFDGAQIQRDRAFLPAWGQPAIGIVTLFHGRVSTIDKIGRTSAELKVKSDAVLLDIDMPRNLWQTGCLHTLYDGGCTLAKARFTASGMVGAGATNLVIPWAGATAGGYDQGTILFTSGANAGISVTIQRSDGAELVLAYPLDAAPAAGDAFQASFGCDHTLATCQTKFANAANFRGFPFVPPPETAY